jgi:hypothetical protein
MTDKELKRLKKLRLKQMQPPECETLIPRWDGICIVAATGMSLTKEVAAVCIESGHPIIAVKQAWRRFTEAEVLYNLDDYWWRMYKGVPEFKGEKWTAHDPSLSPKLEAVKTYNLRVVRGALESGFSTDPSLIHYGRSSGYQAINLALHWLRGPSKRVVLVGFDMQGGYFYGVHPKGANHGNHWHHFIMLFEEAAKRLPDGVEIINATQGSLMKCFPIRPLEQALAA